MPGSFMLNGQEYFGNDAQVSDVEVNGVSVVNQNKVAKINSYKEVTQSEYNALPDSKLTDNILYAIEDVGGSDGFPPLIYSKEEREVGVWYDGRPLYMKTIEATATQVTAGVYTDTDFANLGAGFIVAGYYNCNGLKVGLNQYESASAYTRTGFRGPNHATYPNSLYLINSGYANNGAVITVCYTKTTDTPGSGTWTTQGALAHHYSTDEHVIGTWIDGKPLYEKTISRNSRFSLVADSWAATDIAYSEINAKHIPYGVIEALNDSGYPVLHMGFCLAIINGYININSFRTVSYNNGYTLTLQYTKATDY